MDAEGCSAVGQFQRRFGIAAQGERRTTPTSFAVHQNRRRGVGLFCLSTLQVQLHIGAAGYVEELQGAVVDLQTLELRWLTATVAEEIPVAGLILAGAGLQQHVRSRQANFGQLYAGTQQRPQADVDLHPLGAGHVRLFCPAGVGECDGIGAHGAGTAQVHIQIADMQGATGAGLDGTFDRAFEPVPVPQQDQRDDRGDQQCQDGEPTLATFARAFEAPARRAWRGGCRRSIHALMVACR
ncbi:hypothetical protein D3C81_1404910 [compost metagenome]